MPLAWNAMVGLHGERESNPLAQQVEDHRLHRLLVGREERSTRRAASPTIARTSASSPAMRASAAAAFPAFAVMRIFRPSMPLAWNAMVGLPERSSASIRPSSTSASRDSLSPQVLSTRLMITEVTPARRCRSGRIVPSIIARISKGTPGTA